MDFTYHFAPDPERARALDRRMHAGLAESLEHIVERARGSAEIDTAPLQAPIAHARHGRRLPPAAFGWYYELAIALFDENPARTAEAIEHLGRLEPDEGPAPVVTLSDPRVTRHGDLYRRRMGAEGAEITPPAAKDVTPFRERIAEGFALLDEAIPELADEVRALVHEILLASSRESGSGDFDGASFYQLWGLLMLNPRYHRDAVAVAEVLAHESAHSLLFGFTYDEPLVLNPDDELFPSPLRRDPRPMDGIYHATFVSARMCWTMRRLADNRGLDQQTRNAAAGAAVRDARNFAAGFAVVESHGRLSETGAALMTGARDYMVRETV